MKQMVVAGFLCLACGAGQSAMAGKPESDAIVDTSKKPGAFLATKDEAKDYRVTPRSEKRKQPVTKEVSVRPRVTLNQQKPKLPWAPYAPGD